MEICRLKKEEYGAARELYEEVFPEDSRSFVDYYYREKTKDNQIYGVKEDGGIQAMLHLNPYTLMVNGEEKPANYIVAVATRKEYRRRGYMAGLMHEALRGMYADGQAFTFLMPAAESIYLPHDFRTVYEQEQRVPTEELSQKIREEGLPLSWQGYRVTQAGEPDIPELKGLAEAYLSSHYQVYAKRSEAYYARLLRELASDGGMLLLCRDGGEIRDCCFYDGDEGAGGREKPKIMIRIVDVRRMLMSVRLKSLMAACITVTDPVLEENNRCLTITGTEFSGVMLMEGKEEHSEGTVTVSALASLLFGAKSVEEIGAEEQVKLSGRLMEELKKLVPLSKIYLNEIV